MQIINASEAMPSTFSIAFDFYLEHMWPHQGGSRLSVLDPSWQSCSQYHLEASKKRGMAQTD